MLQRTYLSVDAQKRADTLKARADAYFDYNWLFHLLWDEFKKDITKQTLIAFCDNLQQQREKRFVWAFVESHRSSLKEIREMYEHKFEDEDFGLLLLEERARMIEEFCSMHLSVRWSHVYQSKEKNKPNDSWKIFAGNLRFEDPKSEQEIKRFLYLLDKICLISDILTCRDQGVGIDVNLMLYKRERLNLTRPNQDGEPPRDTLIQAIKRCEDMFKTNTAWAVVHTLCCEDYNYPNNRSQFERYAQDLLKDPALEGFAKGCPNGTLQSAVTGKNGSGNFFTLHSSQWVVEGGYPWAIELLGMLRRMIESIEREKKIEEQKRIYQLSEKGF